MAMASSSSSLLKRLSITIIILALLAPQALSESKCESESTNACNSKSNALPLKVIAIVSILVASMIGVSAPLFTHSVPVLHPDKNLFVIVKSFAAGIILTTGFMHVLPDSFDMLSSSCLKENPWHKFPFTWFVAMLSAIFTLMVDSMATSFYSKNSKKSVVAVEGCEEKDNDLEMGGHTHIHGPTNKGPDSQLLRYRVIAMVLELGIIVHSVVIGISMGASNNICSIKGLII